MTNIEFQAAVLKRFDQMDKRFDQMDRRLDQMDKRLDRLETKMEQNHKMLAHLAVGQTELKQRISELESGDVPVSA